MAVLELILEAVILCWVTFRAMLEIMAISVLEKLRIFGKGRRKRRETHHIF